MKSIILLSIFMCVIPSKHGRSSDIPSVVELGGYLKEKNHNLINSELSKNNFLIKNERSSQDSVRLNTFTKIPNDVEGCVCYFYLSKRDEVKRKYIMTEIFAQIAYISINEKMQKFTLVSFKDDVFYNYTNGVYTMRVEFKRKIKSDNEVFSIKGVLMIFKGKRLMIKKDIIGECSC